jgi:phospholipase/carboxylesterase
LSRQFAFESGYWTIRTRQPDGEGPFPVIFLLHGWTGDENAMWVFADRLPATHLLVAPRGLYATPLGGYGWVENHKKVWSSIADFQPAVGALSALLTEKLLPDADFARISLVGFSQGAALSYALALLQPGCFERVAGLSGFMPTGNEILVNERSLSGKPVFIAHGAKDEIVPIEKAHQAADALELAGARVIYCEDDVGHKLSASCFHGLEVFFQHGNCG